MDINWSYKNKSRVFDTKESAGVPYLSFKALDDTGLAVNGFSTRMGGASRGKFSTMNFSYSRGDAAEDVLENFTRMAAALGVERDRMVVSHQTHTVNLRRVTLEDAGKGVVRERDYRDIDGLITDVPGLTLVTFYADCVPLYLLDPVNRAIGLSHSGWRGTVKRMGQVTVDAMKEAFGTKPEDLIACVGPSICRDCLKWAVKWWRNLGRPLGRNTGKRCIAKEKGPESISWICGRPMKSFSARQAYAGRISISLTSAPCATAIISFHTGKWGRSGETWQRFCALSSVRSAKEKGRGAIWMYYWRSGLLYAAYRLLWRTTDRRSISTFG